jgi:hypothetical protein
MTTLRNEVQDEKEETEAQRQVSILKMAQAVSGEQVENTN